MGQAITNYGRTCCPLPFKIPVQHAAEALPQDLITAPQPLKNYLLLVLIDGDPEGQCNFLFDGLAACHVGVCLINDSARLLLPVVLSSVRSLPHILPGLPNPDRCIVIPSPT
jgi:hypothetical protein